MDFRFYFKSLGVRTLLTFLSLMPKYSYFRLKNHMELWKLHFTTSGTPRLRPLVKSGGVQKSLLSIIKAKCFRQKILLILQEYFMGNCRQLHQLSVCQDAFFYFLAETSDFKPFGFILFSVSHFCFQEPILWLEWVKWLWAFTLEPKKTITKKCTTDVQICSHIVS